jgi:hypothetical protein
MSDESFPSGNFLAPPFPPKPIDPEDRLLRLGVDGETRAYLIRVMPNEGGFALVEAWACQMGDVPWERMGQVFATLEELLEYLTEREL